VTGTSDDIELAGHQVGVELGNEFVREGVGDRVEAFNDREAIADLTHNHGDGGVESFCYRGEDFGARLFLATLHLAEVTEGDARLARDLTKGTALLETEITENVTDFLTN
jgi:hypothetical protein